jgi:hypothetical protein
VDSGVAAELGYTLLVVEVDGKVAPQVNTDRVTLLKVGYLKTQELV